MIDTIAIIARDRIERMTMLNADTSFLLLEEGRKTEAAEISTHCGGGAINAGVAFARLGFSVATLVKLGLDARAGLILERLANEGISADLVLRDGRAPTGASLIIGSHDRNAAIFTDRGTNALLEPSDIRAEALAADVVYVASLSNKSAESLPDIVAKAKAGGAIVAANPGVRQLSGRAETFKNSVRRLDILIVNRHEADLLVPWLATEIGEGAATSPTSVDVEPPALMRRGLIGGGYEMSLTGAVRALIRLGLGCVVVTDGPRGSFLGTAEAIAFCPAIDTVAVSTAGAGDAFGATFTSFWARERNADRALRAATINAASVVARIDTQSGLLSKEEMSKRMAAATELLSIKRWPL